MPKGIYKRSKKEIERIKRLRIGRRPWNKGKTWNEQAIIKMRIARINNPVRFWAGKVRPESTRKKISRTRILRGCGVGSKNWNWKGGKKFDREYKMIQIAKGIYKPEHRLIIKRKLGLKKLSSKLIVHHKDENKKNNNPNNLELMTRKEHINLHLHSK